MADVVEYTYNDRDNTNDLLLKADGTAVSLSSVTRMVLEEVNGDWDVDEADSLGALAFDRSPSPAVTGKVILTLGAQGLTAGEYLVRLIVYDATNTNGIVWGNEPFRLVVV